MRSSLRHPAVGLRDTIAIKLLVFTHPALPLAPAHNSEMLDQAREIVDDLINLVFEELEGQRYDDHQDRWGWFDRLVSSWLLRAQGWGTRIIACLFCG